MLLANSSLKTRKAALLQDCPKIPIAFFSITVVKKELP